MLSMFMALIDSAEQQTKFEKIYYAYRKQMILVAKNVLRNDEQAEDAVQEAFINIAKRIEYIQDDNDKMIKSYVLTAARNAALYIQKQEVKNRHSSIPYEAVEDYTAPSLENQVFVTETADELKAAVSRLPNAYQDALLMRIVHEMEYNEIADVLKKPQATIRQQVARAKKMLIDICEKEGVYVRI